MCDAYYSQDGNPFYIDDHGQHVCETCYECVSCCVEKEVQMYDVAYTLTHTDLSDAHDECCYDIEDALNTSGIEYRVETPDKTTTVFTVSKEQVLLHELAGTDLDTLFIAF